MKKIVAGFLATFIGVGLGIGSAHAYVASYNGFNPVATTVSSDSTLASDSKTAISNACSSWNNAGAGTLVTRTSDTTNTTYPNRNSKNQITKGNRGTNNYTMQTQPWVNTSTNQIVEADIDINTSHPWSNNLTPNTYDVQNTMTHELGHLLGLGDIYEDAFSDSTMWYAGAYNQTWKRSLAQDDKNGILSIY